MCLSETPSCGFTLLSVLSFVQMLSFYIFSSSICFGRSFVSNGRSGACLAEHMSERTANSPQLGHDRIHCCSKDLLTGGYYSFLKNEAARSVRDCVYVCVCVYAEVVLLRWNQRRVAPFRRTEIVQRINVSGGGVHAIPLPKKKVPLSQSVIQLP